MKRCWKPNVPSRGNPLRGLRSERKVKKNWKGHPARAAIALVSSSGPFIHALRGRCSRTSFPPFAHPISLHPPCPNAAHQDSRTGLSRSPPVPVFACCEGRMRYADGCQLHNHEPAPGTEGPEQLSSPHDPN